MIRGRARTFNKLNSPLIVARMKKYLLSKVYAFRFRRRRFFHRRTNKTATLNVCFVHFVHCRPILAMQQLVALRALRNVLTQRTQRKTLRCVRCV